MIYSFAGREEREASFNARAGELCCPARLSRVVAAHRGTDLETAALLLEPFTAEPLTLPLLERRAARVYSLAPTPLRRRLAERAFTLYLGDAPPGPDPLPPADPAAPPVRKRGPQNRPAASWG